MHEYLICDDMTLCTQADVERLKTNYGDDAYQLAVHQIGSTDLDIIAASMALQNLSAAYILREGGGIPGLERMYNTLGGTPASNVTRAQNTYAYAKRVNLV